MTKRTGPTKGSRRAQVREIKQAIDGYLFWMTKQAEDVHGADVADTSRMAYLAKILCASRGLGELERPNTIEWAAANAARREREAQ